jgi:hypothetical protein
MRAADSHFLLDYVPDFVHLTPWSEFVPAMMGWLRGRFNQKKGEEQ